MALLILHSMFIIALRSVLAYTSISYSFAGSVGGLKALKLDSKPPVMPESASAEYPNGSRWARSTAVREVCGMESDRSLFENNIDEEIESRIE